MYDNEVWKFVFFSCDYMVSNFGRIKSLVRSREKVLAQSVNNWGYKTIKLRGRGYLVHRLVAISFFGEPPSEIHQVNHKNMIVSDNRVENLEWVTPRENSIHSVKKRIGFSHKKGNPIVATNISTGESRLFISAVDAVENGFGKNRIKIYDCLHGRQKTHAGFVYNRAD